MMNNLWLICLPFVQLFHSLNLDLEKDNLDKFFFTSCSESSQHEFL